MGKSISEAKLVGGKRKNGHKMDCSCHICENMKNKAKRGGYEEDMEKEQEKMMGGSKKKNGHRKTCKCPICKNMNNSKRRHGGKRGRKTRKLRGGADEDETDTMEEEEEEDMELHDDTETDSNTDTDTDSEEATMGGKRRRKRGNGHKPSCGCPICKNMKKHKKGGSDPMEVKASDAEYEEMDNAERGSVMAGGSRRKRRGSRRTRKHRK